MHDKPECLCYVAALNTDDGGGDDDDNDDDVNCGVCEGDGDSEKTHHFSFFFPGTSGESLVVRASNLQDGREYKASLQFSCSICAQCFAEYQFTTNRPPFGGNCSITPTEGEFWEEIRSVTCLVAVWLHLNTVFPWLTYWNLNTVANILRQLSNAFPWVKTFTFWIKIHRSLNKSLCWRSLLIHRI